MAKKLSVDELTEILTSTVEDKDERQKILLEVKIFLENLEEEKTPKVKIKTKDVTILFGDQDTIDAINTEAISAFTVQIEESQNHLELLPHLEQVAKEYNANLNKKKSKIQKLGEVFGTLKANRHLRKFPLKIHTKESALVLKTTNIAISKIVED